MKRIWTLIALSGLMISGLSNCGAYTPSPESEENLSFQTVTEVSGQTETKPEQETTGSAAETVRTETKKSNCSEQCANREIRYRKADCIDRTGENRVSGDPDK